jgi:hypothetical protein
VQVYKSIPTASGKITAQKRSRSSVGWLGMLFLALVIAVTGMRPLALVNISIIFGMVVIAPHLLPNPADGSRQERYGNARQWPYCDYPWRRFLLR